MAKTVPDWSQINSAKLESAPSGPVGLACGRRGSGSAASDATAVIKPPSFLTFLIWYVTNPLQEYGSTTKKA
jgi:hypothetical protein